jgi:2,5-diketo-D-gluconate reductase B
MEYIAIKDACVPALGLGTWALNGRACFDAVKAGLELGYRHIDTAQIYGNEDEVGDAIKAAGVSRAEIFLTTKIPAGNLRAAQVKRGVEDSLRRLGTAYVDLLLIHWPGKREPLAETLEAFAEARRQGKTRFIGVSNFTVALLAETVEQHRADIICNQVEYHPYLSQRPVIAALRKYGLMLTAYSPLARGRVAQDKDLAAIGRRHGKSAGQVVLRWLLDQPNVAAIPKSARREHLAANLDIFDFKLSPEERDAIDAKRGTIRLVDPASWGPAWDGP